MDNKSAVKIFIFLGICGWYIHYLHTNPKGIRHQKNLEKQNAYQISVNTSLENKINQLKTKTLALESDQFEQEKIIREDLQMSCTNEYVYLLPEDKPLSQKSSI